MSSQINERLYPRFRDARILKNAAPRSAATIVLVLAFSLFFFQAPPSHAQQTNAPAAELGSQTAKAGFRNEDDIVSKFINWKHDDDARKWLQFMKYDPSAIHKIEASKPHGEKADIRLTIRSPKGEFTERISIKLVSGTNGFNQIDKRWVSQYAKMWQMPREVSDALRLFVGETEPGVKTRVAGRMYLNEMDRDTQARVVEFFSSNKKTVAADLLRGSGIFRADWILVAVRSSESPRWVIRSIEDAIELFAAGPVVITRSGNLKIGRITMQRKGGDGGRETAKMLQFKIDPTLLFEGAVRDRGSR